MNLSYLQEIAMSVLMLSMVGKREWVYVIFFFFRARWQCLMSTKWIHSYQSLEFIHDKELYLSSFFCNKDMIYVSFRNLVNESIQGAHECILHLRSRAQSCSECNCTNIMHTRYFCAFWISCIQIGCSMCAVFAECLNALYTVITL